MRTAEEVRAQQAGYNTSQEVSNLVPSYIEGFKHVLDKYYRVTVKAGVTTVQGSKVTLTEDVFLRDVDWLTVKTTDSGSFFYVYLTRTKQLKVDRTPPTYSGKYFCFAHPVFSYRAIGKLWANASGDILWCTSYFTNYTNQITTAQTGYLGYADYYISTEEDASILFQAANDYLSGAFNGGVNTILRGTYTTENTVTLDYGIGFKGEGEQTLIKVNTAGANGFNGRGAASFGVTIGNCKIQNIETTARDKYLINFNGAARSKVESCILDYIKCAGILNDGSNNTITGVQGSGGKSNSFSYGSAVTFNAANSNFISCTRLTDTKFVIVYEDLGNSDKGTAIIGDIAGNVITFGAEQVFCEDATYYSVVCRLADDKFAISFDGAALSRTICCTVSGTTITAGALVTVGEHGFRAITPLSNTAYVIAQRGAAATYFGNAYVCTVSGTTVTAGAVQTFNNANTDWVSVCSLSGTVIAVAFEDVADSYKGKGIIGTVDTGVRTISWGSEYIFNSAITTYINIISLSATDVIIAYRDDGNSSYGTAIKGTIAGTVITYGSEYVFNKAETNYINMTTLTDKSANICYQDVGNASYGTIIGIQAVGNILSYTNGYVFNAATTTRISVSLIADTDCIIGYYTGAAGTAIIASIEIANVYGITSSGNNAIISSNHITADDTEVQEVGIYVSGDESIVVNNQIDGLYSAARNIKLGILVTSDSVRSQVASNSVKNCLNYGYVEYGKNTMYAQNLAFNNGSDTGIGNANQNNWLAAGTGTQQGTNSWQSPVDAEPSVGTLHLLVNPTIWNVLNAGTATTFTDINLSSLIPLGSKAVLLGCQINATTTSTVTPYAMLICRQNGTTVDNGNASRLGQYRDPGPIGVTYSDNGQLIVGCDNNRIIEYRLANTNSIAAAYITLLGYYL